MKVKDFLKKWEEIYSLFGMCIRFVYVNEALQEYKEEDVLEREIENIYIDNDEEENNIVDKVFTIYVSDENIDEKMED